MLPRNRVMTNVSLMIATLLFLFFIAEIVLRFFPVNEGFNFQTVNANSWIFRSEPKERLVQYSTRFNFKLANKKKVNGEGFLNIKNYLGRKDRNNRTLVSVVGDSYIEAASVRDIDTFYYHLDQSSKALDVYSFGFSGAPLSQYLMWANYSKINYDNQGLVINIVGNDFDESLKKYKFAGGFHYYVEQPSGDLDLVRADFTQRCQRNYWGPKKFLDCHILLKSSLFRYLIYNMKMLAVLSDFKNLIRNILPDESPEKFLGNVSAQVSQEREQDSYLAIDAFFRDLPELSGLKENQILFIVDGIRGDRIYKSKLFTDTHKKSYFEKMRGYFFNRANEYGYEYIDMNPIFLQHFKKHGKKFEFPFDAHWNDTAHKLVAEKIKSSSFWGRMIEKEVAQ